MTRPTASVSVVIPCYNEAASISGVVRNVYKELASYNPEILVIDDGSTDSTGAVAAEAGARVVTAPTNLGKGRCLMWGASLARCETLVFIDGDGQDDPADLPRLVDALKPDVDLVIGSRFLGELHPGSIRPVNRVANVAFSKLISGLWNTNVSDSQAGVRVLRRSALLNLPVTAQEYEVETQVLCRGLRDGWNVVELPVSRYARTGGSTAFNRVRHGTLILKTIVQERLQSLNPMSQPGQGKPTRNWPGRDGGQSRDGQRRDGGPHSAADPVILGLWDGHESSACVVANGQLVFALSEERPSRRKRASGFPDLAVARCLDFCAGSGLEVTHVAVAGAGGRAPLRLLEHAYTSSSPHRDPLSLASQSVAAWENVVSSVPLVSDLDLGAGLATLRRRLARKHGLEVPITTFSHHDCHAASAWFGHDCRSNPLVATWDAYGEGMSVTIRSHPHVVLFRAGPEAGLAALWGALTVLMGFKEGDEGKVMGLAARADGSAAEAGLLGLFERSGQAWRLRRPLSRRRLHGLVSEFSIPNLAAGLQKVTEKIVLETLQPWLDRSGEPRLLTAGGLFSNILLNKRLASASRGGFQVFPAMTDTGLSAGSANLAWNRLAGSWCGAIGSMALGTSWTADQVLRHVQASGLPFAHVHDVHSTMAARLAQGKIVCRWTGRDEFGPRALGQRSIFFSATQPEQADRVNLALRRDNFMPFGPVCLASCASSLFVMPGVGSDTQHMTLAVEAKAETAGRYPVAVHLDNTCRPQVIQDPNHDTGRILREYTKLTGNELFINTSFNLHGEPIVHSPTDAISTFVASGLDCLFIDDWEVRRPDAG